MINHRLLIAVLTVAAFALASAASFAYLSTGTTAGSAGRADAGAMDSPSNVVATADFLDVTIDWDAATLDDGGAVEGYRVTRGSTTVCDSVGDATPATTCRDNGAPAGSHTYTVTAVYRGWTTRATSNSVTAVDPDTTRPAVTVNQAVGQADPTNGSIAYTVVFSEPVSGFDQADVTLAGTANRATASVAVTGSGSTYTVSVSGLSGTGTIAASIAANRAADAAGNQNLASTSTDNSVTFDGVAPAVAVNQSSTQADPTKSLPLSFTVTFSEPVTGFDATDLTRTGTSTGGTVNVTGSGASYEVSVAGGITNGTTTFSIANGRAQDAVGNPNSASTSTDNTVSYDTTGPQHSLTLLGTPTGAFLNASGTTLYYRGIAAGTFRFSDAASDALSTVASVTYPAISTPGWTHNAETVSTPAGGPFVSTAFSWQANPSNPTTKTITAVDSLGNTSSANVSFVIDNLAPVNGSISYAETARNVTSVPITLAEGTDPSSGVASHKLQRRSGAIGSTGTCGVLGSFSDIATDPISAFSDTGVANGTCYEYQYVITDNVGNTVVRTDGSVVPVDTVEPSPLSVVALNRQTLGRIDQGSGNNDDRLTFTYSDPSGLGVDPSSIVSGWSGASAQSVSVTYTNGASTDSITVPGIGTVNLGSGTWLNATSTQSATLTMTGFNTFELRVEPLDPAGATNGNAASNFTWSTAGGTAKDHAGNPAAGSVTTNGQRF